MHPSVGLQQTETPVNGFTPMHPPHPAALLSYGLQSFKEEIMIIYGIKVPRADVSHAFQLSNQIPQGHWALCRHWWVSSDPALEFRPWKNLGWEHPLGNSGRCWTDTTKCSPMEMGCTFLPNILVNSQELKMGILASF